MADNLPVEVVKAEGTNLNGNAVVLTARIKVDESTPGDMQQALSQIRSREVKDLVFQERYKFDLANYGISISGGPRPVRDAETNKVVCYELDFKLTKQI